VSKPHYPAKNPLWGVDFTSAPSRRKPITLAIGELTENQLKLKELRTIDSLVNFEQLLASPGPWFAAFDFPFGLPREFVDSQHWGQSLTEVVAKLQARCNNRMAFRQLIDAWGNQRPAGQRLVHRRTDKAQPGAASTSPLQTRYVPVGFMFFEGLPRLLQAGVSIPQMHEADPQRIALEGYPGLLAHELIGARSYKNSDAADRLQARVDMLAALGAGNTRLGLRLKASAAHQQALRDDSSGDLLDAVLCLVQAAWASTRADFGLPAQVDAVEGWIVGAGQR
jgi:hypothetical protein